MSKRIYVVTVSGNGRLIEADNKHQAISFVVKDTISSRLASQSDLIDLIRGGVSVEGVLEQSEAE